MNERIRVGDRVRVNAQTGTVREIREGVGRPYYQAHGDVYRVALDNGVGGTSGIYTQDAVKIEEPEPLAAPTYNPITTRISEHPDDFARRQKAAEVAHDIWGDDADLDRLIGTAEYLLGSRTLGTETTGTVPVPPERFITGTAPAVPSTEALTITDRDGDRLELDYWGPSSVSDVVAKARIIRRSGDASAVYLTESDADALIARLQQFKAALAAGLRD